MIINISFSLKRIYAIKGKQTSIIGKLALITDNKRNISF